MKNAVRRFIAVTALLIVPAAYAQMGGGTGGMHGGGTGNGMGNGTGNGMGYGMNNGMGGSLMNPAIAPDGTVLTFRSVLDPVNRNTTGFEVVAINPDGVPVWTWRADRGLHSLIIAGGTVVVGTGPSMFNGTGNNMDNNSISRLRGLSLLTGSVEWTVDLPGILFGIEKTSDRIYATVVKPGGFNNGGMNGPGSGTMWRERSLVAISADTGVVLWSVRLD